MMNNWRITLKNKQNERQSIINVYIPRVINGKFYNNGAWYNIGKQDFPIPILKIDRNKVMLTTNYQKIEVNRYDTRSLVDIGILTKLMVTLTKPAAPAPSTTPSKTTPSTDKTISEKQIPQTGVNYTAVSIMAVVAVIGIICLVRYIVYKKNTIG